MEQADLCALGVHDMQPYEDDGEEGIGCTECGITPEEL
jgi:hypothetical protein